MQVTITFDMATTENPEGVSAAAARLMMAPRTTVVPETISVSDEAEVTREPAVGQEDSLPINSENITTGKKRGRKSKAETDAENAALTAAVAEEATAAEPVPEAEKVTFTPPPGAPPAMFTPNPASPIPTATFTTPPTSSPATSPFPMQSSSPFPPTVQQPAMPPPQEVVVGDGMTIEDVRAIMALANEKNPGAAFQFMRRETWLDGSPKGKWVTAEGIPADQRERYATELAQDSGI